MLRRVVDRNLPLVKNIQFKTLAILTRDRFLLGEKQKLEGQNPNIIENEDKIMVEEIKFHEPTFDRSEQVEGVKNSQN